MKDLNNLKVDLAEIKVDVKWIKNSLEKHHACKKHGIISLLMQKVNTNRKLILFLLTALLISYAPFILQIIIK